MGGFNPPTCLSSYSWQSTRFVIWVSWVRVPPEAPYGVLAQLVEHLAHNRTVPGSNPRYPTRSSDEMVEIATFCRTDTWICVKLAHEVVGTLIRWCGGIGRHAGFRFLWSNPYGFKSRHQHHMAGYPSGQGSGLENRQAEKSVRGFEPHPSRHHLHQ